MNAGLATARRAVEQKTRTARRQAYNSKGMDEKRKNKGSNINNNREAHGPFEGVLFLRNTGATGEKKRGRNNSNFYSEQTDIVFNSTNVHRQSERSAREGDGIMPGTTLQLVPRAQTMDRERKHSAGISESRFRSNAANRIGSDGDAQSSTDDSGNPNRHGTNVQPIAGDTDGGGIFPRSQDGRPSTSREQDILTAEASGGAVQQAQDSDSYWEKGSNRLGTNEVESIHDAQPGFKHPSSFDNARGEGEIEGTWNDAPLASQRRIDVPPRQDAALQSSAHLYAHFREKLDEVPRWKFNGRVEKFPLLFGGISGYEFGLDHWLRTLGIDPDVESQKFVELSKESLGSVGDGLEGKRELGSGDRFPTGHVDLERSSGPRLDTSNFSNNTEISNESLGSMGAGIEVKREPESVDRFPTSQGDLKNSIRHSGHSKLPLYAPKMEPIDLWRIRRWAREEELETMSWLDDVTKFHAVMRDKPKEERQLYSLNSSININDLLDSGIAVAAQRWHWKSSVRVFSVDEPAKSRRRLIVDCVDLNQTLDLDIWNLRTKFIKMYALGNLVRNSQQDAWYASDFKCWYYQIPVAEVLWPYFSFQHEGRLYYITRLPMGFSASVAIGNTISKIIVRETMLRSRYSEIGEYHGFQLFTSRNRATWSSNVGTTTQVDNVFIFSGDPEIACNFELVTNEAGVLRSESSRQSHDDILGMHYVKTRLRTTVQLTTKYLTKHTKFLTAIVQKIPTWVFWRAAALILRGLAVLQESLSFFYGFMFGIILLAIFL